MDLQSEDISAVRAPRPKIVLVWDMPIRLAHATFIVCIAGGWFTRGAERVDWHVTFGYAALAALGFRVMWGLKGSLHARFASFSFTPRETLAYVRSAIAGSADHYTGHNPAGSWAVYLLLALIGATCVSGIVASGAMHAMGPLAGWVSYTAGEISITLHEAVAWTLLAVIVLHVGGVFWGSRVHRENLALAMLTGRKIAHDLSAGASSSHSRLAATLLAGGAVCAIAYLTWHVPQEVQRRLAQEIPQPQTVALQAWTRSCSECHLAYAPALLPQRSWERMLREQDSHFGEDLLLSADDVKRLLLAIQVPAPSWAALKLATSAPAAQEPLRITKLPYWNTAHGAVGKDRFAAAAAAGPHDCAACHRDAASGKFHPRLIQRSKTPTRTEMKSTAVSP
jgi:cytochrome b